jgi:hypothetical protein
MSSTEDTTPATDWIFTDPVASLIQRKARQLSRSPGFSQSDQPDIEQEFRFLLWRKAAKYSATRAKRLTYASRVIENKAASMARKVVAGKRSYRRNSRSLNEIVVHPDGGTTELSDLLDLPTGRRHTGRRSRSAAEVANLRMDLAEANRHLPASLKRLAALLSHVAQYPAGQVLGMSRKQTARHVKELRELYVARGLAG